MGALCLSTGREANRTNSAMRLAAAVTVVACLAGVVHGYGTGAPLNACGTLVPGHGVDFSTNTDYSLKVTEGQGFSTVTVSSVTGVPFKGFMVQAFDRNGNAVGAFAKAPQTIDCGGAPQSAATHDNPADKTSVSLEWVGPPGATLKAAVVKDFSN